MLYKKLQILIKEIIIMFSMICDMKVFNETSIIIVIFVWLVLSAVLCLLFWSGYWMHSIIYISPDIYYLTSIITYNFRR